MSGVPTGWSRKTLAEIARWGSGGTPQAGNPKYYGGPISWAVIGDLDDNLVTDTVGSITELGLRESSAKLVPQGALLIAMYGSIGKLGLTGCEMATNQAIAFAIPDANQVGLKYLFYYLMHQRDTLVAAGKGATQKNISQTILKAWPIALAPITEQRHIVEILEDHLSRLDAATVGVDGNTRKLDALRLSILSHAFFGKSSWHSERLLDLVEISIGGLWGSESGGSDVDVRVLRVTEMKRGGRLAPDTAARRSISQRELNTRQLRDGDILLEKSGGGPNTPVGRVGLVTALDGPAICSNFMQLMRPRANRVLPRFLHLYLHAFYMRGGTEPMQKASTNIRNLKASEYVELRVPIPDLVTQRRVVDEVELLFEGIARIEPEATTAVSRAASLRRSLLEAAFTGSLTGRSKDRIKIEEIAGV
ncbi:MAG: restriction endonuclease subunit S [Pseudonocardiaceae bacterium]